jgi:site-specific recombinase XerD
MSKAAVQARLDPEPLKRLVLDAVSSPLTKTMYNRALDDFVAWWVAQGRPPFSRAVVQAYRAVMESTGLSPASVNQKLSAIRKLASEAAHAGLLDAVTAASIRSVRGARNEGRRTGNWLSVEQAEKLLGAPDLESLQGKRDFAILALLIGCGLRRQEAARLVLDQVQQRDGRWCIVDLTGKHNRVRTIPMPPWAKAAIDNWTSAAEITHDRIFRGVNRGGRLSGDALTAQGILRCVYKYAAKAGIAVSPHDLRRTYAKLAHKGGAKLDQLQLSLGHATLTTTERYLGLSQDLKDAPCDYLSIDPARRRKAPTNAAR